MGGGGGEGKFSTMTLKLKMLTFRKYFNVCFQSSSNTHLVEQGLHGGYWGVIDNGIDLNAAVQELYLYKLQRFERKVLLTTGACNTQCHVQSF